MSEQTHNSGPGDKDSRISHAIDHLLRRIDPHQKHNPTDEQLKLQNHALRVLNVLRILLDDSEFSIAKLSERSGVSNDELALFFSVGVVEDDNKPIIKTQVLQPIRQAIEERITAGRNNLPEAFKRAFGIESGQSAGSNTNNDKNSEVLAAIFETSDNFDLLADVALNPEALTLRDFNRWENIFSNKFKAIESQSDERTASGQNREDQSSGSSSRNDSHSTIVEWCANLTVADLGIDANDYNVVATNVLKFLQENPLNLSTYNKDERMVIIEGIRKAFLNLSYKPQQLQDQREKIINNGLPSPDDVFDISKTGPTKPLSYTPLHNFELTNFPSDRLIDMIEALIIKNVDVRIVDYTGTAWNPNPLILAVDIPALRQYIEVNKNLFNECGLSTDPNQLIHQIGTNVNNQTLAYTLIKGAFGDNSGPENDLDPRVIFPRSNDGNGETDEGPTPEPTKPDDGTPPGTGGEGSQSGGNPGGGADSVPEAPYEAGPTELGSGDTISNQDVALQGGVNTQAHNPIYDSLLENLLQKPLEVNASEPQNSSGISPIEVIPSPSTDGLPDLLNLPSGLRNVLITPTQDQVNYLIERLSQFGGKLIEAVGETVFSLAHRGLTKREIESFRAFIEQAREEIISIDPEFFTMAPWEVDKLALGYMERVFSREYEPDAFRDRHQEGFSREQLAQMQVQMDQVLDRYLEMIGEALPGRKEQYKLRESLRRDKNLSGLDALDQQMVVSFGVGGYAIPFQEVTLVLQKPDAIGQVAQMMIENPLEIFPAIKRAAKTISGQSRRGNRGSRSNKGIRAEEPSQVGPLGLLPGLLAWLTDIRGATFQRWAEGDPRSQIIDISAQNQTESEGTPINRRAQAKLNRNANKINRLRQQEELDEKARSEGQKEAEAYAQKSDAYMEWLSERHAQAKAAYAQNSDAYMEWLSERHAQAKAAYAQNSEEYRKWLSERNARAEQEKTGSTIVPGSEGGIERSSQPRRQPVRAPSNGNGRTPDDKNRGAFSNNNEERRNTPAEGNKYNGGGYGESPTDFNPLGGTYSDGNSSGSSGGSGRGKTINRGRDKYGSGYDYSSDEVSPYDGPYTPSSQSANKGYRGPHKYDSNDIAPYDHTPSDRQFPGANVPQPSLKPLEDLLGIPPGQSKKSPPADEISILDAYQRITDAAEEGMISLQTYAQYRNFLLTALDELRTQGSTGFGDIIRRLGTEVTPAPTTHTGDVASPPKLPTSPINDNIETINRYMNQGEYRSASSNLGPDAPGPHPPADTGNPRKDRRNRTNYDKAQAYNSRVEELREQGEKDDQGRNDGRQTNIV